MLLPHLRRRKHKANQSNDEETGLKSSVAQSFAWPEASGAPPVPFTSTLGPVLLLGRVKPCFAGLLESESGSATQCCNMPRASRRAFDATPLVWRSRLRARCRTSRSPWPDRPRRSKAESDISESIPTARFQHPPLQVNPPPTFHHTFHQGIPSYNKTKIFILTFQNFN